MTIRELKDLDEPNFVPRDNQRPSGYSATSRVHAGRFCLPILNDTGATCSCITEESLVLLINHTQKMLNDGLISITDYNYPIVQFYRFKHSASLKGAEKNGRMLVEYAAELCIDPSQVFFFL